jgi:cytochrome c peroxidase
MRRLAGRLFAVPLCAAASQSTTITQENRAFGISAISIGLGETLLFSNQDGFTHEIYVETPQFTFESDEQEPGQTVSVTFSARGHFPVHCHIHPKMHLDVDVK